jgi:DNA polymerase II large subunit
LLAPLVDKISASGKPEQEKLLRKALAEDYLRLGDMARAAKAYQTLEDRMQAHLSLDEQTRSSCP